MALSVCVYVSTQYLPKLISARSIAGEYHSCRATPLTSSAALNAAAVLPRGPSQIRLSLNLSPLDAKSVNMLPPPAGDTVELPPVIKENSGGFLECRAHSCGAFIVVFFLFSLLNKKKATFIIFKRGEIMCLQTKQTSTVAPTKKSA